jgi:hypothetical protein
MIPATATKAGTMKSVRMGYAPGPIHGACFDRVLLAWQAAVNERHYSVEKFTHSADQVHGHYGAKYAKLDIAGSGAFMVDIESGIIYQIKGYGKVDKKKNIGNIYDPNFDAVVLVRDRFRYGHFENNPDEIGRAHV